MEQELRRKRLKLNTIFGLLYQVVVIICGFILPRLILSTYGSETNGLVNSINSLLNIITLAELGVGAVVQSTLYKPLADGDNLRVSQIVIAAKRFFRMVGYSLILLVAIITIVYPIYLKNEFDIIPTIVLILAMSVSLFAQYFFGIVNNLLLISDQKGYIPYFVQMIVLILNTLICAILMRLGYSIQIVKLSSACVFLIRPIIYYFYVKKHYNLIKIKLDGTELPNKMDGLIQHIAAYVLENTDIIVLTVFSTLSIVSIYSTYYLIAHSVRLLIEALTVGIMSYYGNIKAKGENEFLKTEFDRFHFYIIVGSSFLLGVTAIMIVPFVMCYTRDVTDANYDKLLFGILLVLGQFVFCIRHSFGMMVLAMGHYKETKWSAIIETIINIVVSIILVINFGLIGVAIGTFAAMLYRSMYYAIYLSKNIINRSAWLFVRDLFYSIMMFSIAICAAIIIHNKLIIDNYLRWVIVSCVVSACFVVITLLFSLLFYGKNLVEVIKFFFKKLKLFK